MKHALSTLGVGMENGGYDTHAGPVSPAKKDEGNWSQALGLIIK
jgi:hypothetical protein